MKPELVIITRQHMRNKKGGKESVSSLSCFQQLNTLVTIPGQQSHIILRRFRYKLLHLHHFHESLMLLPIGWWYQLTIYGKRSKQTWSCRQWRTIKNVVNGWIQTNYLLTYLNLISLFFIFINVNYTVK